MSSGVLRGRTLRAPAAPSRTIADPSRRSPSDSAVFRTLAPIAVGVLAVVVWQLVAQVGRLSPTVLPTPARVFAAAAENGDGLWENTLPTIQVTLIGLACSLAASVVIATAMAFVAWLRSATMPVLIAAQSVPVVVLAPLFVIWFGFGVGPKVLLIVITTALPMTVSLLQGFLSADPDAMVLMRSLGATRWKVFLRLQVPSALPYFFTGLRVVTSFAVLAAIFAETAGADLGLGIYMATEKNMLRTDLVLAATVISIALGLALFSLTYLVEAIAMPWERRRKAMRAE